MSFTTLHCIKCKRELTANEINYCRNKLNGRLICYSCQGN